LALGSWNSTSTSSSIFNSPLDLDAAAFIVVSLGSSSLYLRLATASVFFLNAFKHLRNLLFNVRTCVRCSPRRGDDDDDDEDRLAPCGWAPIHLHFHFQLRFQLPRLWRDDEANITNLRVINRLNRRPSHS